MVFLRINAVENLDGFSATLYACGTQCYIPNLGVGAPKFAFSATDVSTVTEDLLGEYGTLSVYDNSGDVRLQARLHFRVIDMGGLETQQSDRTICISLPRKYEVPDGGSGGLDPSKYATKEDLNGSIEESKTYTDDKIAGIGEVVITEQEIKVKGPDGLEKTMTVKEAVQSMVDMQDAIDHSVSWEVKDEDEDGQPDEEILYFHKKEN